MSQQQLFASFLLDKSEGLEIALRAETVAEATLVNGKILPLPASLDFVEGIMHLRDEAIPIINMKKRLGLTEHHYDEEAKVAVVHLFHRRYGLLFDDIMEVFRAEADEVQPLDTALQTSDKIISALIHREKKKRTVELMDLGCLFAENSVELEKAGAALAGAQSEVKEKTYSRYVIFDYSGQSYGVPVECVQEITFVDSLSEMFGKDKDSKKIGFSGSLGDIFRQGDIDGTLQLRGRTIPVLYVGRLLTSGSGQEHAGFNDTTRVMVLANDGCHVALIVEKIMAIDAIPDEEILSMDGVMGAPQLGVTGIYQHEDGRNITLLEMKTLVCDRLDELKAMSRLSGDFVEMQEKDESLKVDGAHHLITENCYLIFGIGKTMAIQLKDVQEIIEKNGVLSLPGESGFRAGIINLRGDIVPVINLRKFFNYEKDDIIEGEQKLVICKTGSQTVAFEVDSIVTIHKQEKYQPTTSLNAELAGKRDVLDRLIVFDSGDTNREHVLVLNVHNLIRNHIDIATV
ncbi:MAG: purine-binding chemotaxis protein CheW [Desulforhopalus sp.]|jgi:purine-binding chemotaxis protein CheW